MHLIHRARSDTQFERIPIPDRGLALRRSRSGQISPAAALHAPRSSEIAHVVPFVEHDVRYAALIVAPGVRDLFVGGRRPVDVQVLAERDEIVIASTPIYFTARNPLEARLQDGDSRCGVCGEGTAGCVAIACSHCAAVTHAGALGGAFGDGQSRECFAHRGSCPGCGLAAEDFDWLPDGAQHA